MLHSRLLSPKSNNLRKSSIATNPINRSKSSASFVQMVSKMEIFSKNSNNTNTNQEVKVSIRAQSAFKKNNDDNKNVGLPKVNSLKGKLCLGKMIKPGMILSTEARHNPWADPNPINEAIINRKGLMEMINMGMLPKNSDFTELLNHRYEPKQK